ncbi:MAG: arylamine N-acetyltransferase [Chloroflexi bacterium]|nr:arylamine N-acetyltransferase [Chloroflexota bacterium]
MPTSPLLSNLAQTILSRLGVIAAPPTLSFLEALVNAYVRAVPWETVFRIVKRARVKETAVCPRWPDEFWTDNLERGGGGTCFESNYAFFSLLRALGYSGYLTVNNMGDSIGCHTAIILIVDGMKWLVDAGYPLYAPIPISSRGVMRRATAFMNYAVYPDGEKMYQVKQRPHPKPNAFTLIDRPVADAAYRAATTADYGPNGYFLDRIVINKVVDGTIWRFNSAEKPWRLSRFRDGIRLDVELNGKAATAVAQHFQMDETVMRFAFSQTDMG